MQGNDRVLATLNRLLSAELTAISQYVVHAEMCDNWGYATLGAAITKRSRDEMRHAHALIERIVFLQGTPAIAYASGLQIGASVSAMIDNDYSLEMPGIRDYNAAIRLAYEVQDQVSADLFASNLSDEERHVNWLEEQRTQISQMGLDNYLASQLTAPDA